MHRSERPLVDFKVVDQDGSGFVGLPASAASVHPGAAPARARRQFLPSGKATSTQTETPAPGVGPGTQPTIQSKTDSGGNLANHGDGTYTYTFGTNISAVTTPLAVPFVPTLTHRVAIALSSDTLPEAAHEQRDIHVAALDGSDDRDPDARHRRDRQLQQLPFPSLRSMVVRARTRSCA